MNNLIDELHQDRNNDDHKEAKFSNLTLINENPRDNVTVPPKYYHAVIQQPIRLLSSSYTDHNLSKQINKQTCQSLTLNPGITLNSIIHSSHSSTMIQQYNSPEYIPSYWTYNIGKNSGTILTSSSTLSQSFLSHLSMINKKPTLSTKTWFPYFTFLTGIIMFAYFVASIMLNIRLTGMSFGYSDHYILT